MWALDRLLCKNVQTERSRAPAARANAKGFHQAIVGSCVQSINATPMMMAIDRNTQFIVLLVLL
jgi:hypothetical protein